jgi:hypothetical protein
LVFFLVSFRQWIKIEREQFLPIKI